MKRWMCRLLLGATLVSLPMLAACGDDDDKPDHDVNRNGVMHASNLDCTECHTSGPGPSCGTCHAK